MSKKSPEVIALIDQQAAGRTQSIIEYLQYLGKVIDGDYSIVPLPEKAPLPASLPAQTRDQGQEQSR